MSLKTRTIYLRLRLDAERKKCRMLRDTIERLTRRIKELTMPRKKSPVPTPKHVTPAAKAARAVRGARRDGKKLRVVAGTAAARALGIK